MSDCLAVLRSLVLLEVSHSTFVDRGAQGMRPVPSGSRGHRQRQRIRLHRQEHLRSTRGFLRWLSLLER